MIQNTLMMEINEINKVQLFESMMSVPNYSRNVIDLDLIYGPEYSWIMVTQEFDQFFPLSWPFS